MLVVLVVGTRVAHAPDPRSASRRCIGDYQKTETSVTGYVADLLRGSRDVKLYAMEEKVAADFEDRVWQIGHKSYSATSRRTCSG